MPNHVIRVDVYSRPNCHLCEEAKETLQRLQAQLDFELQFINIETDPALEAQYGTDIPVVLINGTRAFKYRVNEIEFERMINGPWNK